MTGNRRPQRPPVLAGRNDPAGAGPRTHCRAAGEDAGREKARREDHEAFGSPLRRVKAPFAPVIRIMSHQAGPRKSRTPPRQTPLPAYRPLTSIGPATYPRSQNSVTAPAPRTGTPGETGTHAARSRAPRCQSRAPRRPFPCARSTAAARRPPRNNAGQSALLGVIWVMLDTSARPGYLAQKSNALSWGLQWNARANCTAIAQSAGFDRSRKVANGHERRFLEI